MITQRFKINPDWTTIKTNHQFMGLINMLSFLSENLDEEDNDKKMIEVGSYMGESTFLFACSNLFSHIDIIEPHSGDEEFNDILGYDWDFVKQEFETNTRFFDNIIHHKDYSYNVVDDFSNDYDFIYVDGNHDYDSVKRDLELYLPKVKNGGFIGGHDYSEFEWPEVVRAVNEVIGEPDHKYWDSSWIKKVEKNT